MGISLVDRPAHGREIEERDWPGVQELFRNGDFYPGKYLGATGDEITVITADAIPARSVFLLSARGGREKYVHAGEILLLLLHPQERFDAVIHAPIQGGSQ